MARRTTYRTYAAPAPAPERRGNPIITFLIVVWLLVIIALLLTFLLERLGVPNPLPSAPGRPQPTAPLSAPVVPPVRDPQIIPRSEPPGPPAAVPQPEIVIPAPQPLVQPTPRFDAPNSLDKRTVEEVAPVEPTSSVGGRKKATP